MVRNNKWFQRKGPNTLGGWCKSLSTDTRRRYALESRPKNWTLKHRYTSAAQALQALSNVTRDVTTKRIAGLDARHFYTKAARLK